MDHSANNSISLQSSNAGGVDFDDFSSKYSFFDSFCFIKPSSSSSFMTAISPPPPPPPPPSPNPNHPPCVMTKTPSRISKKRPRVSRRPPTTVFTTNTSNFRSMVQQFTGIPFPPFPRHRPPFDYFKPSLYSQKKQQLQPSAAAAALNINASSATDRASLLTSFNYQQPPSSLNIANINESPIFGSGSTDFGAPQYGLIGSGWGQGEGADPTRYGCKLDFSGSGLMEMNGDQIKGGDVQAGGGEGMVESWNICSSD